MKTKPKRSTRPHKKTTRNCTATSISTRSRPRAIGQWLAMKEARRPGFVDGVFKAYADAQTRQARVSRAEPRVANH